MVWFRLNVTILLHNIKAFVPSLRTTLSDTFRVKVITLSETKICIPITFVWEFPPLSSGADAEQNGTKLHVVVSKVDETTLLTVTLIVAMTKGTGMNGKKRMKNILFLQ